MRKLLAILLFSSITSGAASAGFADKDVLGRWYRGEMGYVTKLVLSADHTYSATWHGDDYTFDDPVYGRAHGKWKLHKDTLVLTPAHETKKIRGDLPSMKLSPASQPVPGSHAAAAGRELVPSRPKNGV